VLIEEEEEEEEEMRWRVLLSKLLGNKREMAREREIALKLASWCFRFVHREIITYNTKRKFGHNLFLLV
jgi:hypothetical protein